MLLYDRDELRTDFRPLRLSVMHHASCQQRRHGIDERLIVRLR